MNSNDRQFVVLVIGVALIAAALRHVLIEPMRSSLTSDRQALVATRAEIETGPRESDAASTARVMDEIEHHADGFRELWAGANDASALYDMIQEHAADSGVHVENIEPRRSSVSGELAKEFRGLGVGVSRLSYGIELQGDFNSVRAFVKRFQTDSSLVRIDSIRLAASRLAESPEAIKGSMSVSYFSITGAFAEAPTEQP